MFFVDIVVNIGVFGAKIASFWSKKAKLWIDGRNGIFERMILAIKPEDQVIWFHAASLGEFEEGRPVIEKIRSTYPQFKILLSFFSPSGYEIRKNYPNADWVFYLPADTSLNMKRFLDIVHPEVAIFIKYEFWPNLLLELRKRSIRSYAISARFIPNSRFFKWYGGIFRSSLNAFDTFFVQDDRSIQLLKTIGFNNSILAGDPRFDRVEEIAKTEWRNEIIERFKGGRKVFIAGSTCGAADEDLLQVLINKHPNTKFIIIPHEMLVQPMEKIETNTVRCAIRYSKCTDSTDLSKYQVLIVDTIGMLALLYRYGNWAYIGGGFVAGIHSVIEATIYGMPAVFGPNYQKNRPGIDMVKLGACCAIANAEELDTWFTPIENDDKKLEELSKIAYKYTQSNLGATETIIKNIFGD